VRVLADRQIHRQTDRQTQTDFIIYPMLYAIAMGQMKKTETDTAEYIRLNWLVGAGLFTSDNERRSVMSLCSNRL